MRADKLTTQFQSALADDKGEGGRIVRAAGMNRKSLDTAIDAKRGGETVGSAEAEGQREALKKYCIDLTDRARQGKLDPVIGRDDEIREDRKFKRRFCTYCGRQLPTMRPN